MKELAKSILQFDKYEQGGDVTYLNGMRVIGAGLESWR